MRRLAPALLAVAPAFATAQPAADDPAVDLTVRPRLCVTDRRTPECTILFVVSWQSDRAGDYCLHNDFVTTALECWTGERAGETTEQRIVRNEFTYWMTGAGGERRLASETVEVLSADEGDRRRKRRARHVWDVL